MKRMTRKDWERILGYAPGPLLKKMILARVRDEGISIKESASMYALPPVFVAGVNEPDSDIYDNDFRPAVYITHKDL
jgi:hypothetical protein